MSVDFGFVDGVIAEWGAKPESVIAIMQAVQERYRYIPREVFPYLAGKLGVSEARIYGVATFYKNFSLEAKGRYVIKICDGTACHVRKSTPIMEKIRAELGLSEKKITTCDLAFTVETVACLGACSLAPALTVNDKVYPNMTTEKAMLLLGDLKKEFTGSEKGATNG
jgi:NADH-quinone oxidoreductase subunit E